MGCVLIWEWVVSKIRERVCKEEILQLYSSQLSFKSCARALKIYSSSTTASH